MRWILFSVSTSGPMFNHDNFAGIDLAAVSRTHELFTDSRYDLWGSVYAKEEWLCLPPTRATARMTRKELV